MIHPPRSDNAGPDPEHAVEPGGPAVAPPGLIRRLGTELSAWLKTLASAVVYATVVITFGVQVARVDGESMTPTLADQDRLIVNKLEYGLLKHSPRHGDIVMLLYPWEPAKSYVKRVVAGPGDTIRSEDGRVYLNDVALADDFIPDEFRSRDIWGPHVVPPAHYFVMGDHRNNSTDSRVGWFVPEKYIVGRVQVRWWPVSKARVFRQGEGK